MMNKIDLSLKEDYPNLMNNSEPVDVDDLRYEEIFKDLQGGILKNYGRNYYLYLFISFDKDKSEAAREWIRHIAGSITSTYQQFQQTKEYRKNKQFLKERNLESPTEIYSGEFLEKNCPGQLCKNLFLSYQGYRALKIQDFHQWKNAPNAEKIDPNFVFGMKNWWNHYYKTQDNSNANESPSCWDIGGEHSEIHALLVLTHDNLDELEKEAAISIEELEHQAVGKVVACEVGYPLRERNGIVGPFGFIDGVSQPLFFKNDYDAYKQQGTDRWDPKASLNLVLTKDPFGEVHSFGSYCVWQKLETNYQSFLEQEKKLAEKLGCDLETAGALAIGRFRDGTPISLSDQPQNQELIKNNFDYTDDYEGTKCPIHAHIRKVNPRGDQAEPNALENHKKSRIMRAGVTYFDDSKVQQKESSTILDLCLNKLEALKEVRQRSIKDNIEKIGGLLFVCFQNSIVNQFQEMQLGWADSRSFPRESADGPDYLDPIIGHLKTKGNQEAHEPQEWPKDWGEKENFCPMPFERCVHTRGGEFFFAPSLSFLKKL